jgi:hypothetical protein
MFSKKKENKKETGCQEGLQGDYIIILKWILEMRQ